MSDIKTIGIVGARGHTGIELIGLIARHPRFELAFVSSRELDGQNVHEHVEGFAGEMRFVNFAPGAVAAQHIDALILALPNGSAGEFIAAVDASKPDTFIIDLSADHRFRDDWYYGLPELTRTRYAKQRRISNPGCYATAMQLAIAPLKGDLVAPPTCFGVSGYSGAGTTASDRNDPDKLRDNLMPYSLVDHVHEREVTRQLGVPVEFMPHVAPYFRGIMVTLNLWLQHATNAAVVKTRFLGFYKNEPLVRILDDAPWVSAIAGKHHVEIGGFAVAPGGKRVVLVATIDNLLKGAATQAIQNLNIAFGFDEYTAIPLDLRPGAVRSPL